MTITSIGLHESMLDHVRIDYRPADGPPSQVTGRDFLNTRAEQARPVRTIPQHHGQTNTPGLYWCATDRSLHSYESYLECRWMTMLDFDTEVVAFLEQPFCIHAVDGDGPWKHTPDLFVRRRDQTGQVIDVRSAYRAPRPEARRQSERTEKICDALGWEYRVVSEPPEVQWANVAWLAGYRRPFELPPLLSEQLLDRAQQPIGLCELIGSFAVPETARVAALRACWFGQLRFDPGQALDDDSLVWAAVAP